MRFARLLNLVLIAVFCVSCSNKDEAIDEPMVEDALQNLGIEPSEEVREEITGMVNDATTDVRTRFEEAVETIVEAEAAREEAARSDEAPRSDETEEAEAPVETLSAEERAAIALRTTLNNIFSSIETGDIDTLKEEFAKLDNIDSAIVLMNKNGNTPLTAAVRAGQNEVVDFLTSSNLADVNAQGGLGYTPLTWAALEGNVHAAKALLANPHINPNIPDMNGRTPLVWSVVVQTLEETRGDRFKVLSLLLASDKVNPNIKDTFYGRTPLVYAVDLEKKGSSKGRIDVVKAVLGAKNKVDVSIEDKYGFTAHTLAEFEKKQAIVNTLAAKQKEPGMVTPMAQTPLPIRNFLLAY